MRTCFGLVIPHNAAKKRVVVLCVGMLCYRDVTEVVCADGTVYICPNSVYDFGAVVLPRTVAADVDHINIVSVLSSVFSIIYWVELV